MKERQTVQHSKSAREDGQVVDDLQILIKPEMTFLHPLKAGSQGHGNHFGHLWASLNPVKRLTTIGICWLANRNQTLYDYRVDSTSGRRGNAILGLPR